MPAMNVQRRLGKFTIVVKLFEMKQIKNAHLKLFFFLLLSTTSTILYSRSIIYLDHVTFTTLPLLGRLTLFPITLIIGNRISVFRGSHEGRTPRVHPLNTTNTVLHMKLEELV